MIARAIVAAAILTSHAWGADELPAWAKEASTLAVSKYPSQVRVVELLHEEAVTVEADGRRVVRERGVVKIVQANATWFAGRTYDTKAGRIRDFQAWTMPPSGKSTAVPKNRISDVAVSTDQVYDEARAKVLDFPASAAGTIHAYEITEEEKTTFTQYATSLQGRMPRLVSRFSLTLPPGWEMRDTMFNHAPVQAASVAGARVWELRDLPWLKDEDYGPPLSSLAPFLAVSYFAPEGNTSGLRNLKDWTAVSTWLSDLVDPPAAVTPKIRAKAAELTAGAGSELEKIRAIARFAQQTNYVAVSFNVTRGGGYTPHRAEDVLQKNYGDCKDKATLMRALLKAVGIESYVTVISADDPKFVRPEWASPMQFNHAIIAVAVSDGVQAPTVVEKSALGRLLIFDPTDPLTPVGDLPEDEQGSYALVIAGARGELLKMPKLSAEANRIQSEVTGQIDTTGRITATLTRSYYGQSGMGVRATHVFDGTPELQQRFARSFSRRIPGAVVANVRSQVTEENRVALNLELTADRFAQINGGRLFVVRPGLLTSGGEYYLDDEKRTSPIQLTADLRRDSVRLRIPAGFQPDELPVPAVLEGEFGRFEVSWKVAADEIVMEETLAIRETEVAASEYEAVRDFFDRVAGHRAAPVVLIKK